MPPAAQRSSQVARSRGRVHRRDLALRERDDKSRGAERFTRRNVRRDVRFGAVHCTAAIKSAANLKPAGRQQGSILSGSRRFPLWWRMIMMTMIAATCVAGATTGSECNIEDEAAQFQGTATVRLSLLSFLHSPLTCYLFLFFDSFLCGVKLKVLGLTNHETIALKFNETSHLYYQGKGDTSHTITFDWCGPLLYHTSMARGNTCYLVLDDIWKDSPCAVKHHLPSKMRRLRMEYPPAGLPQSIKMTADIYTVWPMGWKKTTWLLEKQERAL